MKKPLELRWANRSKERMAAGMFPCLTYSELSKGGYEDVGVMRYGWSLDITSVFSDLSIRMESSNNDSSSSGVDFGDEQSVSEDRYLCLFFNPSSFFNLA